MVESKHAKHTLKSFKSILSYARSIPQLVYDHHNFKLLKPFSEKGDGEDKKE